jgi:uncharacterized protein (TIGR02118 family)
MIHQLIFAAPRPGMSEAEFQDYWVNVHAVQYASKIPQIRKYLIDTRIPLPGDPAPVPWGGVAEIWLENDADQLASLQTREFLEGARQDEPRWAAFWLTLVLDTDAHEVVAGPPLTADPTGVKLITLVKRRAGTSLDQFREHSRTDHAGLAKNIPGLRRYLQGYTRDGAYQVGEAVLDAAYQMWFDDVASLQAALDSAEFQLADADLREFTEPRYIHRMLTREHWVIGPEPR